MTPHGPDHDDLFDAMENPAPDFDASEAETLALRHFGIEATATPLVSYSDLNFRLTTKDGPVAVLKIANSLERPEVIDLQHRALAHIAALDPGLPVPRVIKTLEGEPVCRVQATSGSAHLLRALSWMPGIPARDLPSSRESRHALGRTLARLGIALRGLFHPAADHATPWNMLHALQLRRLLPYIQEDSVAALVGRVLDRFERLELKLKGLRAQLIFNDLNPDNVLLDPDDTSRVSGIIDFGDILHAPLVIDLAIAATYQLTPGNDPLAGALDVVRAYTQVNPLEDGEAELLPDLVQTRLATSLAICNWRAALHPENREYILTDGARSLSMLEALDVLPRPESIERFRQAARQ